ncbi:hypothetical protein DPMN_186636 [Dreissena polymorpha]|uniref:Uncharacterized protein n=1 Tax=Dreissena polymorpha TaxID=45954 RepID=A0A9D4DN76_DREPO|nr:hypothetical protein DPMN_186636 [Dreissena polymorpha]
MHEAQFPYNEAHMRITYKLFIFLKNSYLQELQQTLNKLKGSLSEVQKLNAIFCEGASRKRCGPLKGERLNHFCDWLNEKEEKLNAVNEDKTNSPEKKLEQAKVGLAICCFRSMRQYSLEIKVKEHKNTPGSSVW